MKRTLFVSAFVAMTGAGCALLVGYGEEARLGRSDAGSDAGSEAAFCEQGDAAPSFCASFDQSDPFVEWDTTGTMMGRIAVGTTIVRSPPASLLAETFVTDGAAYASITKGFSAFANRPFEGRIQFDVNVDRADPNDRFAVIADAFIFANNGINYILQFVCNAGGIALQCSLTEVRPDMGQSIVHATGSMSARAWHRVGIDLTIAAPTGTGNKARVDIDGETRADTALVLPCAGGTPFLDLGVPAAQDVSGPWGIYIDNVRVDIR